MISEKWKKKRCGIPLCSQGRKPTTTTMQCTALDLQKGEVMLLLMGHHWPLFQKKYA